MGTYCEFKVNFTPSGDRPAYSQSLPAPLKLKDDITVELAPLHKHGMITFLSFSKYVSQVFAHRKPNGHLRLLVDLRRISDLIPEDYINNNHPVSTLSDAAQHMPGKKRFCKLHCSQTYHCLQMADYQSIQMLPICKPNFCLSPTCSRAKQITISIFKLHERVPWQSNQSRPMCTISGWHWHCSKRYTSINCKHQDCFWLYPKRRTKTHNIQMTFRCQISRLLGPQNYIGSRRPSSWQSQKVLSKKLFKSKKRFNGI